ncbi:hypothetical protein [Fulvimarina sp. MAC3]|uniref:DUF6894 family protein n=1 Tax=Fulvimarina sp. MAC3 TaxID=3148887 RepID=UPI0031FD3D1F
MATTARTSQSTRTMPTFYFDVEDDRTLHRDETGIECDSSDAIQKFAIEALPTIASERVLEASAHTIAILVRDEAGAYVFRAEMTLTAGWLR